VNASIEQRVLEELERRGVEHELVRIPPEEADTAVFCERHGYPLSMAANAIVVATKRPPRRLACCVVLGTRRLDVNRKVREIMGGEKVSFASAEDMRSVTGMEVGGVTPFCLPDDMPLFLCGTMLEQPRIIVGTGGRTSKILLDPHRLAELPGARVVSDLSLPR
jgi:prolyl-tRNA editing enzyme YbaK/EbsC (Cys-tRNA(Pro) deacylase)